MKLNIIIATCLVIITSACSTIKKTNKQYVDNNINNIAWAVISFKGKGLHTDDFPNGAPTIVFDMQDGKINGNDGCNSFRGLANYRKDYIKPGPIASTKMACPNTTILSDFYEVLGSEKITYRLINDVLRLYVNDAEVMVLKEKQ
jgi:heat shock protein HslJ